MAGKSLSTLGAAWALKPMLFLTCHVPAQLQWWAQLFSGLSERVFLVPGADLDKLNNEGIFL